MAAQLADPELEEREHVDGPQIFVIVMGGLLIGTMLAVAIGVILLYGLVGLQWVTGLFSTGVVIAAIVKSRRTTRAAPK